MDWIIISSAIIYFLGSHLIAEHVGRKRRIGYGGSVFISIVFSPVIGLIATLLSSPLDQISPEGEG